MKNEEWVINLRDKEDEAPTVKRDSRDRKMPKFYCVDGDGNLPDPCCYDCGTDKEVVVFVTSDGFRSHCKECTKKSHSD